MKKTLFFLFLTLFGVHTYSQPGTISNIQISQRTDGSMLVDIYYDLSGGAGVNDISVEASFDGGSTFSPVPPEYLEGAVSGVSPGSGRHIVWDGMGSFPNTFSTRAQIRMLASGDENGGTCPPTFTDPRDGQTYTAVQIGDQCWMAENLNYDAGSESWCYDNNATNCDNYGRLYTWDAAMNGQSSSSSNPSGVQGICPDGWHVPSHHEWTQLEQYICNALGNSDCETHFPYNHSIGGLSGTNEGNALKSCRQVGSPLGGDCDTSEHPCWNSHSTHYGFDEFGFSAFPGGSRRTTGSFEPLGTHGRWWSSTENTSAYAWRRNINRTRSDVFRGSYNKAYGFSLRCVRDVTDDAIYNLDIDIQPENSGSFSGAGNYAAGAQVNITATPNAGWIFTGWTGNSDYIDNPESANTFVTMPAYDISLTANFEDASGCPPTFTDPRDGQTYTAVQIGNQCWMAENLNYDTGSESWCYGNNATNCDNYGRLYTWDAAMNGQSSSNSNPSGVQGICPDGWHLPSDAQWTELVDYLDSQGFPNSSVTGGAGNALKSCRQVGSPLEGCNTSEHPRWHSHSTHYGFDEFDFSALPGGIRFTDGSFNGLGGTGYWWSSKENSSVRAWARLMGRGNGMVIRNDRLKSVGYSLRCVRD